MGAGAGAASREPHHVKLCNNKSDGFGFQRRPEAEFGGARPLMLRSTSFADGAPPSPATKPSPMMRRAASAGRAERASLITEPSPGQDRFYDGAYDCNSIASRTRPVSRGEKYSAVAPNFQAYSASFKSKVPMAYKRPLSREQTLNPMAGVSGGPLHYSPWSQFADGRQSQLSGSVLWYSRGRTGPIGCSYETSRRTVPFISNVPARHYGASAPPVRTGTVPKQDCFVLKSDDRHQTLGRNAFHESLHTKITLGKHPLQRSSSYLAL